MGWFKSINFVPVPDNLLGDLPIPQEPRNGWEHDDALGIWHVPLSDWEDIIEECYGALRVKDEFLSGSSNDLG